MLPSFTLMYFCTCYLSIILQWKRNLSAVYSFQQNIYQKEGSNMMCNEILEAINGTPTSLRQCLNALSV